MKRRLMKPRGLAAPGRLGLAAPVAQNRYYQGPVSDHFDGVRFFSPGQPPDKSLRDLLRWQLGGGRKSWPDSFPSPFKERPPAQSERIRITLVGHATVLIQVAGL